MNICSEYHSWAWKLQGYVAFSDIYLYTKCFDFVVTSLWDVSWRIFLHVKVSDATPNSTASEGWPGDVAAAWNLNRLTATREPSSQSDKRDEQREMKNGSWSYNPVPPSKDFRWTKPELKSLASQKKKKSDKLACVLKCTVYQRHSHCTYDFVSQLDSFFFFFF